MPLSRNPGEALGPVESPRAARRTLLLLCAVAVLGAVMAAAVGLWGFHLLSAALHRADVATGALRLYGEVDQMHDALRADILSIRVGSPASRDDFERHVRLLERSLQELDAMALPAAVQAEMRHQSPGLHAYVAAGRALISGLGDARDDGDRRALDLFTDHWRELEGPLADISDDLRAVAADAEAAGLRDHRQGLYLMAVAFLVIVCALVYIERKLARGVLDTHLQLLGATERAVQAGRSRADFLAAMSHEIRTPMTGVLGMVDLLAAEDLDPRHRSYIEALRASGQHLLAVINDILDFTRIESGKLQLEQIDFSLPALLEQLRSLVAPLALERGIGFHVELAPHSPPVLRGDPTRIRQVLLNLSANGVKFTERGSVTVRAAPLRSDDGRWRFRFEVCDTGVGIPPEAIPHLFSAFSQADQTIARRYGGSGLGLAICKRLIDAMGGQIGVHSLPGGGSVFHFELDLPEGDPDHLSRHAEREAKSGAARRILVAEDVEINRRILQRGLERAGHQVVFACDGTEALELVQRGRFDLVLMDVQMPVMDGVEATHRIRGMAHPNRSVPILALTANVLAQERERYLEAGMDGCLTKPIDWDQLLAAIDALDRRNPDVPETRPVVSTVQAPLVDDAILDSLMAMGSRAQLVEWLQIALQTYHAGCAAILEAGDDVARIAAEAHKMKGSAGTLGLQRLEARAIALEQAALSGGETASAAPELQDLIASTWHALQERGLA